MTPAVSVLLPYRDAGRWLDAAVESILGDGLPDLELLLLDDGSRDDGPARAALHARRDTRVRLLGGPPRGLVATLNLGLSEARAPLIARMDGDDISLPGRLQAQVDALRADPSVAVVDGRVEMFRDDGPVPGGMLAYGAWLDTLVDPTRLAASILVESPLVHPAILARRAAVEAVGGYVDDGPEDYGLWLRLAAAGHRLLKLDRLVLRWRDHSDRLTRTDARYGRTELFRLKWAFLERMGALDPGRRLAIWGAGKEARPWLRAARAAGLDVVGAVDIDPRKQGTTRHGYPTFPVDALPALPFHTCLIAVGARGAREEIRAAIGAMGLTEAPPWGERGCWFVA